MWCERACDTIIKLCLRAQRLRALAHNHIIHIISYHTNKVTTFPFLALESLLTYLPILYQNIPYLELSVTGNMVWYIVWYVWYRMIRVYGVTIPRGSVREREMDTYVGISVTDRDRNKGFRALGGNPPKG